MSLTEERAILSEAPTVTLRPRVGGSDWIHATGGSISRLSRLVRSTLDGTVAGRVRVRYKAVKMLGKKVVGVVLVSHKMNNFDPAIRLAVNISIFFRAKYGGDSDAIARL